MFLSAFVAASVALQSPPAALTELLGVDVPDEFQIGNHQRNSQTEIIELVVPPDTVNDWSKLITELALFRAAQVGPDLFYYRWLNAMRSACPGLKDTMLHGTVDGRPAIRGNLSCPLNPRTQKPENLSAFLVQGDADLLMVQVAFRHAVTPADAALISRVAGTLKMCDQKRMDLCSARKGTGFRTSP